MDYTASIHDADHPADASPWGNSPTSSPQADRTTFSAGVAVPPASPPAFGSPSNGFDAHRDDADFTRPRTASTVSEGDTETGTIEDEEGNIAGQQQPGAYNDENASPSQAHEANRFSGDTARPSHEQPQIRKSTQPQYKLQAKITGLERAAKKDPILRFDVHVSIAGASLVCELSIDCSRPTFRNFAQPNSGT